MKKIFGVALAWILVSTASIAQEVNTQHEVVVDKAKTCIPTKECAKKAGVTLEECQKICAKGASTDASTTKVASASLVADTDKKAACTKADMTSAKCKATCQSKSKTASLETKETKVASSILVKEVEEIPTDASTEKKCVKGQASCAKKKG